MGQPSARRGRLQLYAILVSVAGNVLASETVNTSSPIGAYSFGTSDGVQDNTSYTVVLSTTAGSVGNPPVITLPTGWVNTADGSGTGDGTPDGQFTAAVVSTPETVDFGLDQLPTAGSGAVTLCNPGGTNNAIVPADAFTNASNSTNPDGAVSSIRITGFPTNATSITINGNTYTSLTFPGGGVTVPTDGFGQPSWVISVYPISGASTIAIDFVAVDNAAKESDNTGTATESVLAEVDFGTLTNADETLCSGGDPSVITFSTAPSGGAGTFAYQWYYQDGLAGSCPGGTGTSG